MNHIKKIIAFCLAACFMVVSIQPVYAASSNAKLQDLKVNGRTISQFDRDTYDYSYYLSNFDPDDFDDNDIPEVTATTEHADAYAKVYAPKKLSGEDIWVVVILVTAEDKTELEYRINFYGDADRRTVISIKEAEEFAGAYSLPRITIEEVTRNTIYADSDDFIILKAPEGFKWKEDAKLSGTGAFKDVKERRVHYEKSGSTEDETILLIGIRDVDDNRTSTGRIYIDDLVLTPSSDASYGTVRVRISGCGIEAYRLEIGEYVRGIGSSSSSVAGPSINLQDYVNSKVPNTVMFTAGEKSIIVGSQLKTIEQAPYMKNGRLMIPLKTAAEGMGVNPLGIQWNEHNKTIYVAFENVILQYSVGVSTMYINGAPYSMDLAPEIVGGVCYVPVRYVGIGLGYQLSWDALARTAILYKA